MEDHISHTPMSAECEEVENSLANDDVLLANDDVLLATEDVFEDKVDEPKCGMLFADVDEMFEYYKSYGKQMGFPVKRRSSSKNDDGVLRFVTFSCGRSGKPKNEAKNILKPYPSMKTNCQARLGGSLSADGMWRLNSIKLDHNHGLSPSKSRFFRCNREISSTVKRQLELNDRAGIRVNKNFNSMVVGVGTHENLSFLEKDARNFLDKARRLRLGEGDATAIQNYFMKMQSGNLGFFSSLDLDDDGRLRNVFWADLRSREAYKEFGDVITFDTTYLTNKYDMPFAPFVGVNHHGQSTLLGCGLIASEDTETFCWLFKTWLACMHGKTPPAIITDQDTAMKKAIEIVFPNSRHRWCLWHILKKFPAKLGSYKDYHSISFELQGVIYDSQTRTEFEERWSKLIDSYKLQNNDWLSSLYDERGRWVPSFVKDSFWAGMSTTQRSESINAFFDGYVNSKTSLKQFVEQYGNALKSKVEKETQADSSSFSKQLPCVTIYDMETQVQQIYTMTLFKEFQKELTGKMYCVETPIREDATVSEYDVREDVMIGEMKRRMIYRVSFNKDECEVKCSCLKFEFRGILCRHAITVLIRNDVLLIPEKYILRRWRKDVKRSHTRVIVQVDGWNITTEQIRYDKLCTAFNKLADLAVDDEENFTLVIEWINDAMKQLSINKGSCGSKEVTAKSASPKNSASTSVAVDCQTILDPMPRQQKGRPRLLRIQRKIAKKRKQNKIKEAVDASIQASPSKLPNKTRKKKAKDPVDASIQASPSKLSNKTRQKKKKDSTDKPPIQENVFSVIPTQESIGNVGLTQNSNIGASSMHSNE